MFEFVLTFTHAECIKSVVDILLSVDVPVLTYYRPPKAPHFPYVHHVCVCIRAGLSAPTSASIVSAHCPLARACVCTHRLSSAQSPICLQWSIAAGPARNKNCQFSGLYRWPVNFYTQNHLCDTLELPWQFGDNCPSHSRVISKHTYIHRHT